MVKLQWPLWGLGTRAGRTNLGLLIRRSARPEGQSRLWMPKAGGCSPQGTPLGEKPTFLPDDCRSPVHPLAAPASGRPNRTASPEAGRPVQATPACCATSICVCAALRTRTSSHYHSRWGSNIGTTVQLIDRPLCEPENYEPVAGTTIQRHTGSAWARRPFVFRFW